MVQGYKMARALGSNILSIIGSRLLLCVLCVQVAFAMAMAMAMAIFAGDFGFLDSAVAESVAGSAAVGQGHVRPHAYGIQCHSGLALGS
jgi:hypothetical protein